MQFSQMEIKPSQQSECYVGFMPTVVSPTNKQVNMLLITQIYSYSFAHVLHFIIIQKSQNKTE